MFVSFGVGLGWGWVGQMGGMVARWLDVPHGVYQRELNRILKVVVDVAVATLALLLAVGRRLVLALVLLRVGAHHGGAVLLLEGEEESRG